MPVPAELFLSHATIDRAFADALGQVLERHHIPYWYSQRNLQGAQQWHDEIGRALERCDWFVLVLTPAAVTAEWVKRELMFALGEPRFRERIVPLLVEPCEHKRLSWTLGSFQFVDFAEQSFEDGCRALLRIWSLGYIPAAS